MRLLKLTCVALGLAVGTAAIAQNLTRLPPDYAFPKAKKSPGPVTFKHSTHVDAKKPDCTVCHPTMFKITEKGATADGRALTHKLFEKGEQCGACHNEKKAFGLEDCERCHNMDADDEEPEE